MLRTCVLLDELIEAEGPEGSSGPIVVAQASGCACMHVGEAPLLCRMCLTSGGGRALLDSDDAPIQRMCDSWLRVAAAWSCLNWLGCPYCADWPYCPGYLGCR